MIPTTGGFSAEGDAVLMGLGCITRSYYGNAKSVSARLTTARFKTPEQPLSEGSDPGLWRLPWCPIGLGVFPCVP